MREKIATALIALGIVLGAVPILGSVGWVIYMLIDVAAGGNYGNQPVSPVTVQFIASGVLSLFAGMVLLGIGFWVEP